MTQPATTSTVNSSATSEDVNTASLRVREYVVESLRAELVGPSPGLPAVQFDAEGGALSGQEILRPQDSPRLRYGAGILFPQRSLTETQDSVDAGSADAAAETKQA